MPWTERQSRANIGKKTWEGKMAKKPVLRSLSDIYAFFRQNQTPIYFLSPTPYNVLGLGRWISKFEYINFFDSFDGHHPKAMVPREHGPHEFRSIEDVNNHLLKHSKVRDYIKARGPGYLLLVMLDEETEQLAKDLGMKIALPRVKLRKWIEHVVDELLRLLWITRTGDEIDGIGIANRALLWRHKSDWQASIRHCRRSHIVPGGGPDVAGFELGLHRV